MNLLQLQRTMARALMQPLTASEQMRTTAPDGRSMRAYAARFIKPNDRLTSFERLEIYNRQYWFRLLSSMAEDYPGLQAVLGERRFEAMSKAYLVDCPSRSFTLRNLGAQLESWLKKNPSWAGAKQKLALDMVRLEWAETEVFDGKAEQPITADEVRMAAGGKLRLKLQPYIRLLRFSYPVDDLLLSVRKAPASTDFASNAVKYKRKHVRTIAKQKPAVIYLAMHRVDFSVYFRRLQAEEFAILGALREGKTLNRAIAASFEKSSMPIDEQITSVGQWFQNWSSLGWFCRTPSQKRSR